LLRLQEAIELRYRDSITRTTTNELFEQIRKDENIIGLFCLIMNKRLFIIDDLEFVGKRQALRQKFLSPAQVTFSAQTLNQIAYCAFQSEQKRDQMSEFFLSNIKDALSSLVSRDHRLKLFPADFWVIDKNMVTKSEYVPYHKVQSMLNPIVL